MIVSIAEIIIVMLDRTGKVIFCLGPMDHIIISALVGMITDPGTNAGTRDTIAMIVLSTDMETNIEAGSIVNVVKVS